MLREPAVAGTFYDDDPSELRETIDACYLGPFGPGKLPMPAPMITRNIIGLICPHAGLRFSGYAAAWSYYELAEDGIPDTAVILGPNHRGLGAPAAIMTRGEWATPLGNVQIDSETATAILSSSGLVAEDPIAHQKEHSIEVQLPFLQTLGKPISIVPIIVSLLAWEDAPLYAEELGRSIAQAISGKNAVVIASTDFTHYEPKSSAEAQDRHAIEAIAKLDAQALVETVIEREITMCGVVPAAAAVVAAKKLGATSGEKLTYYTSGDILGDESPVVGYGALMLTKEGIRG
jgi:AmmeMemoRadiSam system protein B